MLPIPDYLILSVTLYGRYYYSSHHITDKAETHYMDCKSRNPIPELYPLHT